MAERLSQKENKGLLEKYKTFNKVTLGGSLLLASAGVGIAYLWAAVDAGQIVAINKYEKWKANRRS